MSRILGIDYGTVRMGLAISDPSRLIARTLITLTMSKQQVHNIAQVVQTIQTEAIDLIVIGLPLHMDGCVGVFAAQVQLFAKQLEVATQLEVVLWDERLTTVMAERTMREAALTRKKRIKAIDAVAAVIILQGYLDYLHHKNRL